MENISNILTVASVSLLAAISPGPDFFIVLKNSLTYSRKAGLLTALGISAALMIHLAYTIIGIGALMTESSFFYYLLKYSGAVYLFYVGLKGFLLSFKKGSSLKMPQNKSTILISHAKAFQQGFLTNLLNPKCALFFVSFFSQFIVAETPLSLKIEYGLLNWGISLGWFLFLSYLITAKAMISKIDHFRLYVDRIMGILLMLLGIKLFM